MFLSDCSPGKFDLFCDVVLSRAANADINTIDFTEAEQISGFIKIITSNSFKILCAQKVNTK